MILLENVKLTIITIIITAIIMSIITIIMSIMIITRNSQSCKTARTLLENVELTETSEQFI